MKTKYNEKQIQQFWVGLIDADGSVQCNHWRKRILQYRIVIHMHSDNIEMLKTISEHLGGSVRRESKSNMCVWVEDHQRRIWKLMEIFDRYPPLTTRVQSQIAFLKECALRKDVEWMIQNRDNRYNNRDVIEKLIVAKNIQSLHYFPIWCSGFIEGEGCFSIRDDYRIVEKDTIQSFSIAQKNDRYLIDSIRTYFGGTNRVRSLKNDMYLWEVYKRDVVKNIIDHCEKFPLLGKKKLQLDSFVKRFKNRKIFNV